MHSVLQTNFYLTERKVTCVTQLFKTFSSTIWVLNPEQETRKLQPVWIDMKA